MEHERIEQLLRRLRLPRIRQLFREWVDRCSREETGYADFLGGLLEEEGTSREEAHTRNLLKRANFPFDKTLEQFDFRRHPELRRQVFQNFLDASFIKHGHTLVLIGAAGLGKTHLGVAIGTYMVQRGFDVRFSRVQSLVNRVIDVDGPRERDRILRPYIKCDLLILDELGYLMPDVETGPVLYELIAERYERKATIITSNKSLTDWGKVLNDTALASALVDRLMHHGEVYYLKGESYRLKGKKIPTDAPTEKQKPNTDTEEAA